VGNDYQDQGDLPVELTVESQACRLSIKLGAYAEIDGQYSDWDDLSPTEADLIASQVKKIQAHIKFILEAREDRTRIDRLKTAIQHAVDNGLDGPEAFDAFCGIVMGGPPTGTYAAAAEAQSINLQSRRTAATSGHTPAAHGQHA
jgi:hypothetical protein